MTEGKRVRLKNDIINVTLILIGTVIAIQLPIGDIAKAGEEGVPAYSPSVWPNAAINAVVLQYTYTGTGEDAHHLSRTARQLSILVYRSVLYSIIKYGPAGATQIVMIGDEDDIQPNTIFERILGVRPGARNVIKKGHALVFLWGHLYEEGEDIYIQSYIKFLRRGITETIALHFDDRSEGVKMLGKLPSQTFAFAPRKLTVQDLDRINAEFKKNVIVREHADINASGYPLDHGSAGSYAYRVLQAQDEWMKIEPIGGGKSGWIRTEVSLVDADLRVYMPELHFVEAAAGYLRYHMSSSDILSENMDIESLMHTEKVIFEAGELPVIPSSMRPEWVQKSLTRYEQMEIHHSRRAKLPAAVAKVMRANFMIISNTNMSGELAGKIFQLYSEAADLVPFNADLRNLKTASQITLHHLNDWDKGKPIQFADELFYSLSLDPGNSLILANLETFYKYLNSISLSEPSISYEDLKDKLSAVQKVRSQK